MASKTPPRKCARERVRGKYSTCCMAMHLNSSPLLCYYNIFILQRFTHLISQRWILLSQYIHWPIAQFPFNFPFHIPRVNSNIFSLFSWSLVVLIYFPEWNNHLSKFVLITFLSLWKKANMGEFVSSALSYLPTVKKSVRFKYGIAIHHSYFCAHTNAQTKISVETRAETYIYDCTLLFYSKV